jgi:pentapeptide repeat protein
VIADNTETPARAIVETLDRLIDEGERHERASFAALVRVAGLDPAHDFIDAFLVDLDFRDEDLRGFDFSGADLSGADFRRANVAGVRFEGAILTGAIGLKRKMLVVTKTIGNRTSEPEMRIGALRIAASKPNGYATTTQLKDEMPKYVDLTVQDLASSKTRPNEAMYHQIIGNIVSHQDSRTNIFARGLAVYTGHGIQITDAGREFLRRRGF